MTRLINIKTKIHSHAYPFYVALVLRHVLFLFWKQCVSTDGASDLTYVNGKDLIM